jgi:hypothetical protein
LVKSTKPSVPVSIILSPPFGVLSGQIAAVANAGVFPYANLGIDIFGLDYLVRFSASFPSRILTTTSDVFVSFSAQYAVRARDAEINDRVCASVAVSGTIAVCGAPSSNISIFPIQSVTTTIGTAVPVQEIQVFETTLVPRKAIQQFHTTGDVGAMVGGSFQIMFGAFGPTRDIPAEADASMLQVYY